MIATLKALLEEVTVTSEDPDVPDRIADPIKVAALLEACIRIGRQLSFQLVRAELLELSTTVSKIASQDMPKFRSKRPTPHKVTVWLEAFLKLPLNTRAPEEVPAEEGETGNEEMEAVPEEAAQETIPEEEEQEEAEEDPNVLAARKAAEEVEAAEASLKEAAEFVLTMRGKIAELKTYKVGLVEIVVAHLEIMFFINGCFL